MRQATRLLLLPLILAGILATMWLRSRPEVDLPSIATSVQRYSGILWVAKEIYFEAEDVESEDAILEFFEVQAMRRGWAPIDPSNERWGLGEWSSYQSSSSTEEVVHQRLEHWRSGLWSVRVAIRYRSSSEGTEAWRRQEVTVFIVPFELMG